MGFCHTSLSAEKKYRFPHFRSKPVCTFLVFALCFVWLKIVSIITMFQMFEKKVKKKITYILAICIFTALRYLLWHSVIISKSEQQKVVLQR